METLIKIVCAIFLPPLAVGLHRKPLDVHFWLCLILWLACFHLGGMLYAFGVLALAEDTREWKLDA